MIEIEQIPHMDKPEETRLTRKAIALRALIVFFAAMVVLTVVARAVDAMTLPQVKTTTISSGKLTHAVRTEGTLEAMNEVPILSNNGLTVARIHAVKGEAVKAGDPLLSYDQASLQKQIDAIELELRRLDLKRQEQQIGKNSADPADPSMAVGVERAKEDIPLAQDKAMRAIARAEQDLLAAREALVKAEQNLVYVERTTAEERKAKAQSGVESAQRSHNEANTNGSFSVEAARLALEAAQRGDENGVVNESEVAAARQRLSAAEASAQNSLNDANATLAEAQRELRNILNTPLTQEAAVKAAQAEIDSARTDVQAKERALEDAALGLDNTMLQAHRELEDAQNAQKRDSQQRAKSRQDAQEAQERKDLQLQGIDLDIEVQQMELRQLQDILASGAVLTAHEDGVITEVLAKAGETLQGAAFRLALTGEDCYVRASITDDQAKLLSAGAEVNFKLSGENGYQRGGEVKSLRPTEEGFELLASLSKGMLGQSVALRVEHVTQAYEQILPLSALVKMSGDRDGVYVLRQRQGILGLEDYVELLSVEVLDKDGTYVAIHASLGRDDLILESSNKPVNEDDRVRRIVQ